MRRSTKGALKWKKFHLDVDLSWEWCLQLLLSLCFLPHSVNLTSCFCTHLSLALSFIFQSCQEVQSAELWHLLLTYCVNSYEAEKRGKKWKAKWTGSDMMNDDACTLYTVSFWHFSIALYFYFCLSLSLFTDQSRVSTLGMPLSLYGQWFLFLFILSSWSAVFLKHHSIVK